MYAGVASQELENWEEMSDVDEIHQIERVAEQMRPT